MTKTMKKNSSTKTRTSVITKRNFPGLLLVTLLCAACADFSFAQKQAAGNRFAQKNDDRRLIRHYGLIFGTAYGPDDRPLYGVKVVIRPAEKKRPGWELLSDHRGEFAQRVPPGPADYVVTGEAEVIFPAEGPAHHAHKKRLKAEARVHFDGEERQDVGLHLTEHPAKN